MTFVRHSGGGDNLLSCELLVLVRDGPTARANVRVFRGLCHLSTRTLVKKQEIEGRRSTVAKPFLRFLSSWCVLETRGARLLGR